MATFTGSASKKNDAADSLRREGEWQAKRVFFSTPQCVNNDLASGACPAEQVVCIVVDEAHKATKEYAYCQVEGIHIRS